MSDPSSLGALVRLIRETEVVERRRWLSKQECLDGLALCQMLPGPASTQLGVLICHARGGLSGALIGSVSAQEPVGRAVETVTGMPPEERRVKTR